MPNRVTRKKRVQLSHRKAKQRASTKMDLFSWLMVARSGISFANSHWTSDGTPLMDVLSFGKESGFPNECSFNALKRNDQQPRTGRAFTLNSFLYILKWASMVLLKRKWTMTKLLKEKKVASSCRQVGANIHSWPAAVFPTLETNRNPKSKKLKWSVL